MKQPHNYHVYIVTNSKKSVFYTGVSNDLERRIIEHWQNRGNPKTFAGLYHCYNLIYYEHYHNIHNAITREKEIKSWRRQKKLELARSLNPELKFYNKDLCGNWPPL